MQDNAVAISRDSTPSVTTSHYVCAGNQAKSATFPPGHPAYQGASATYQALGYAEGELGINGIVILDFGQPTKIGNTYGTYLPNADYNGTQSPLCNGTASTADIYGFANAYVFGFMNSRFHGGSGRLTLAIGTNNCAGSAKCVATGGGVTPDHARAWAGLVNELQENLGSDVVTIVGASDMELEWNTPAVTLAWVDAYLKTTKQPLINYGDAVGCPNTGVTVKIWKENRPCATVTKRGWTQYDVWYISGGARGTHAFPEIYRKSEAVDAQRWLQLCLYAYYAHGDPLNFLGAFTDHSQEPLNPLFNTPPQAYTQLSTALKSCPKTALPLPNATDITPDRIQSFYSGTQLWEVPKDVTQIPIVGAGGLGGGGGGEPGYLQETVPVVPGGTLAIFVGGNAVDASGGFNGGGPGGSKGRGGGGASDVREGGSALADRIFVAGGAGGDSNASGGDGGGLVGGDGMNGCLAGGDAGGNGGSQVAGGHGGGPCTNPSPSPSQSPPCQTAGGSNGDFGIGGGGGGVESAVCVAGGGGGGGYFGGGGGGGGYGGGGGGGGSSFSKKSARNVSNNQAGAIGTGYGFVAVSWYDWYPCGYAGCSDAASEPLGILDPH